MLPINLIAVVVAAVAAFIIGFLFHGPLFGKLWMKLANVHMTGNEKVSDMIPKMAWNFLVNIVSAYVLSVIYLLISSSQYVSGDIIMNGILVGLLLWLVVNAATVIDVIWMGKSVKLWLFEYVSSLIVFAVMGAIIASWK
jgi:hypothetical protein